MWQVYLPLALFLPRCERDSTTDGEAPPVVGIPRADFVAAASPVRRLPTPASPTMAAVQRARFDLHNPRHLVGLVVAVAMWVVVIALSDPTVNVSDPFSGHVVTAQDARSYYGLNLADLYTGRSDWNSIGAYPYSPAFAQLVYPLDLLPWPVFVAAWTAILIGAVYWLTGPDLFLLGLLVGAMEIAGGNITLLLAVAIVAGFQSALDVGVRDPDQDHAGRGADLVRAASRVAAARHRAGLDGARPGRLVRADARAVARVGGAARSRTRARAARGRRSRSRCSSADRSACC